MTVQLGALASRVILQSATDTTDGAGGSTRVWSTVATPWARVEVVGGGEQIEGGQDPSRRTFEVTLRRRNLVGAYRLTWGSVVMSVVSIKQDDSDREFSVLTCVEEPEVSR